MNSTTGLNKLIVQLTIQLAQPTELWNRLIYNILISLSTFMFLNIYGIIVAVDPNTIRLYPSSSHIMKSPSIFTEEGVLVTSSLVEIGGIVIEEIPSIFCKSTIVLTKYVLPETVRSPSNC